MNYASDGYEVAVANNYMRRTIAEGTNTDSLMGFLA